MKKPLSATRWQQIFNKAKSAGVDVAIQRDMALLCKAAEVAGFGPSHRKTAIRLIQKQLRKEKARLARQQRSLDDLNDIFEALRQE
jgi:hypothetical protein